MQTAAPPPPSTVSEPPEPSESLVRPVTMPLVDRIASGVVTGVPPLIVVIGMWLGWIGEPAAVAGPADPGTELHDHRDRHHRRLSSAADPPQLQVPPGGAHGLCDAGVRGGRGPGDRLGRHPPQAPPVLRRRTATRTAPTWATATGWRGALRDSSTRTSAGCSRDMEVADERRYAKDLLADPLVRFVDRTFVLWVAAGLAAAFGLGVALTGTVTGGLTALLWGGAARIFFMHHATFSINSLCHYFGRHDYDTGDESRNLAWLAIPTWGEAWHNNHHAFPTLLPPRAARAGRSTPRRRSSGRWR